MQTTVKQLAAVLNVAYPVASALVALMESKGVASKVGKIPAATANGKGKPSVVYQIPASFTVEFFDPANLAPNIILEPAAATVDAPAAETVVPLAGWDSVETSVEDEAPVVDVEPLAEAA
jgi:hypothetical protein